MVQNFLELSIALTPRLIQTSPPYLSLKYSTLFSHLTTHTRFLNLTHVHSVCKLSISHSLSTPPNCLCIALHTQSIPHLSHTIIAFSTPPFHTTSSSQVTPFHCIYSRLLNDPVTCLPFTSLSGLPFMLP